MVFKSFLSNILISYFSRHLLRLSHHLFSFVFASFELFSQRYDDTLVGHDHVLIEVNLRQNLHFHILHDDCPVSRQNRNHGTTNRNHCCSSPTGLAFQPSLRILVLPLMLALGLVHYLAAVELQQQAFSALLSSAKQTPGWLSSNHRCLDIYVSLSFVDDSHTPPIVFFTLHKHHPLSCKATHTLWQLSYSHRLCQKS